MTISKLPGGVSRLEVPRGLQILTVPGLHGSGPAHWQICQRRYTPRYPTT